MASGIPKGRIILLSVISLIAIVVLSFLLIIRGERSYENASSLEKSVILSTKISALVHELQKERGRTAGYLGSHGKDFKRELQQQRMLTDEKIRELQKYLNKKFLSSLPPDTQRVFLSVILNELNNLSQVRIEVDSLSIPLQKAIAFYTKLDSNLIDSVALLARHATNAQIADELIGYSDFMYAKDKAGLERAVLSVAFVNQKFPTSKLFTTFVNLMAQQKAFIKAFSLASPEKVVNYYKKVVVSSQPSEEVSRYEELALSNPFQEGSLNVNPDLWFSIITKKIDLMHQVESFIAKDLLEKISQVKSEAKGELFFTSILSLVAILVIVVLSFLTLKTKEEG
ncbi:nitrate- and nitrite sensing domain-containing protein [Thermovibrio sp.]